MPGMPAVTIVSAEAMDLPALQRLTRLLADLAAAQPRSTLILTVEQSYFDIYLLQTPVLRAKALLLEGVVSINQQSSGVGSKNVRCIGHGISSHPRSGIR